MSSSWLSEFKAAHTSQDVAIRLGCTHRNRAFGPCVSCGATARSGTDSRAPCTTDPTGKGWMCWACQNKGDAVDLLSWRKHNKPSKDLTGDDWEQLRQEAIRLGLAQPSHDTPRPARVLPVSRLVSPPAKAPVDPPAPKGRFSWSSDLAERCADALWKDGEWPSRARNYLLAARCLSKESIQKFKLGLYVDKDGQPVLNDAGRPYITIPLQDTKGVCVNVRFRSIGVAGSCEHCSTNTGCKKCREYRVCSGRPLPLFNAHRLSPDKGQAVIVTEGELDVVAMDTYGFTNAVSGTGGAATWSDEWLDVLEPHTNLIGLYDADEKGAEGWAKVAAKLGAYRCARALLPCKDAGEALFQKVPVEVIEKVLAQAKPEHGIMFQTVDHYADDIETLIDNPDRLKGLPTGSVKLDRILGGWRPGLEIFTGETGNGKTTLITWLLYLQAQRGIPVALTSFEQQPIGTVQKLLRMQVEQDFTAVSRESRQQAIAEISRLPLYILDHYGQMSIQKAMETMRYAKRRLGVRIFMIDHLGFLIDPEAKDERIAIQMAIREIALFAKFEGITIFMVVHPSNAKESAPGSGRQQRVTMHNLKGASAIRQDADDVLVIVREPPHVSKGARCKRPWPQTRIYLDKARSEFASPGSDIDLAFDPGSCQYADLWDDTPAGRKGQLVPYSAPDDREEEVLDKPRRRKAPGTEPG